MKQYRSLVYCRLYLEQILKFHLFFHTYFQKTLLVNIVYSSYVKTLHILDKLLLKFYLKESINYNYLCHQHNNMVDLDARAFFLLPLVL